LSELNFFCLVSLSARRRATALSDAISRVRWLPMEIVIAFLAGLCLGVLGSGSGRAGDRSPRRAALARHPQRRAVAEHLQGLTVGTTLKESTSFALDLADSRLRPIKETLDRFEGPGHARSRSAGCSKSRAIHALLETVKRQRRALRRETGQPRDGAARRPDVRGRWADAVCGASSSSPGMSTIATSSPSRASGTSTATCCARRRPSRSRAASTSSSTAKPRLDATSTRSRPTTATLRRTHLERHARLVREHITKARPEAVLEALRAHPRVRRHVHLRRGPFWRAGTRNHDPSLLEAGLDGGSVKVIPASPTTLIALLRLSPYGWQQETVAESARALGQLAGALRAARRLRGPLRGDRRSLDGAIANYNRAVGLARDASASWTARKFPESGVSATRSRGSAALDRPRRSSSPRSPTMMGHRAPAAQRRRRLSRSRAARRGTPERPVSFNAVTLFEEASERHGRST